MADFGRIMALDVGDVRTGVALTDPMQMIASPHTVVQEDSLQKTINAIVRITQEQEVIRIIVGIPLNQEGKRGPQAEKVLAFTEALHQATALPIDLQDERFTTAQAQRMLISANVRRKKRKQVVDKIAATEILQTWLARKDAQSRGLGPATGEEFRS